MTTYDLIMAIYKSDEVTTIQETIEDVNDIIWQIDKDPKAFVEKLSKELEEFASMYNMCPLCGDELSPTVWYEDRPYGDTYVKEKMVEYRCKNPECGG